jgi:hypothetical protein
VLAPAKLRLNKNEQMVSLLAKAIGHGMEYGRTGYFHELSASLATVSMTVLCASLSAAMFSIIRRRLAFPLAQVPAERASLYSRPPFLNRLDMEAPVAIDTEAWNLPLLKKTIDGRWMHPEVGC